MDFYELVNARFSIREYSDQPVPDDAVRRILDAARLAPSAANKQPWHFYVIRDAETRQRLFPTEKEQWIASAPVILVVCSSPGKAWVRGYDGKNHADIDTAIAMEHIVLAATEEGLATCWICSFDPGKIRDVLSLPFEVEPVAITPLGYGTGKPIPRHRKSLEEVVTWR